MSLFNTCNQSNHTATWHAKHQVSCVLFACQASSRPSSAASSGRSTPDGGHAQEAPVLKTTSEPPPAGLTSLTSSSPAPSAPPSPNARVTSKKGWELGAEIDCFGDHVWPVKRKTESWNLLSFLSSALVNDGACLTLLKMHYIWPRPCTLLEAGIIAGFHGSPSTVCYVRQFGNGSNVQQQEEDE